ncbi:MAG: SnoaL-like domain-containing protein [Halobacteria archaeon]|nr:SnoaL-like domain-containing protein [Halobacteria archaeon]
MSGFSTPEAAEAAFYAAFANCDIQAMDAVWADTGVICIHPGSTALLGRDVVMRSWMNILTQADPPNLHIEVLSRTVSNDLAVHVVEEYIAPVNGSPESTSVVLATNVYCLEADGWRLLEHHASIPKPRQTTH